jgi:hypothetical protein
LRQTLRAGTNVATIDNIPPGPHKIVILAKNINGEVIDRKEVNVSAVAATVADQRYEPMTAAPAPAPAPPPAPVAPAYVPPPPPPPAPPIAEEKTLPTTGSAYPRVALAGLALASAGLLLARKSR